jgi:hypothetical protein
MDNHGRRHIAPFVCLGFFASFLVWCSMILVAPLRLQLVLGAAATLDGRAGRAWYCKSSDWLCCSMCRRPIAADH